MDPLLITVLAIVLVLGAICLVPVLLFRPLLMAISNRISGKPGESDEVKALKKRLAMLECQVSEMQSRMGQIEDSNHFTHKVLEDVVKKTNPDAENLQS